MLMDIKKNKGIIKKNQFLKMVLTISMRMAQGTRETKICQKPMKEKRKMKKTITIQMEMIRVNTQHKMVCQMKIINEYFNIKNFSNIFLL